MSYLDEVAKVADRHRDEIEGELDLLRFELRKTQQEEAELKRRVEAHESLLALLEAKPGVVPPERGLTLHEAMAEVLSGVPGRMLRASELAQGINRRRLYKMRDGRPVEPQQIHARVGHYPHLFKREGTFIKLA